VDEAINSDYSYSDCLVLTYDITKIIPILPGYPGIVLFKFSKNINQLKGGLNMSISYLMKNSELTGNFEVNYTVDGIEQDPIPAGGESKTGIFIRSIIVYGTISGILKGSKTNISASNTMKDQTESTNLTIAMNPDPETKTWTISFTTNAGDKSCDSIYQSTTDVEVIVGPDGQ
jgi:hypothetical protein